MGGAVFNSQGLTTPRMSPATFTALQAQVLAQLSTLFQEVRSPPECPEKTSYGDVDFLVQDAIQPGYTVDTIKQALGATHTIKYGNTWSYAIPDTQENQLVYRQVDVHICHGNIDWELFIDAYGDLWTVLGSLTRFHGFLCDDKAFNLLVSPIVETDKKNSRLPLSSDPKEVLNFMGLDVTRYYQGFETVDDMFVYITTSRFYHPRAFAKEDRTHSDRAKYRKRPTYAKWLEDFLPSHPDLPTANLTKEKLAAEAIETFGKEMEREAMLDKWQKGVDSKNFWSKIANMVPREGYELGLAMRGLKRRFVKTGLEANTDAAERWAMSNWHISLANIPVVKRNRATAEIKEGSANA